jgi:hypothetical protein
MGLDEILYGLPKNYTSRISAVGNINVVSRQVYEVAFILVPLAVGPYDDVWL